MSLIKSLLLEFQSQNYLYHFTNPISLGYIFNDNKIEGSSSWSVRELLYLFEKRGKKVKEDGGVSLTRNRELPLRGGKYIAGAHIYPMGIVFDRGRLKHRYKLYSFDVHEFANMELEAKLESRLLDEEIILGDIEPVKQFIEFVYIPTKWLTENFDDRGDINVYMDGIIELHEKHVPSRIPFKYFDKGNFQKLEFPNTDMRDSEKVHYIYKQLFEK